MTSARRIGQCALLGVVAVLLQVATARAGAPVMAIATVRLGMADSQVVARLGQPTSRNRHRRTGIWRYPDRLTVWMRRTHGPRSRLRVVGVRTRSSADRVRGLHNVHVGDHERRLKQHSGIVCFNATVADPAGRDERGRFCPWPTYRSVDPVTGETGPPDFDVRLPVLLFSIVRHRVTAITLELQPKRRVETSSR
jgi:hypothetical protein